MRKKNPQHYVDKNEMMEELIKYNETEIISEELGLMFYKIAEHYGSQPKFAGYSCIEEMKSSAVERMLTQAHKFDVTRSDANPFAYFTLTTHRQFLAVLKKEKRQWDIKQRYRKKIWEDLCIDENLPQLKNNEDNEDNEDMNESDNY